MVPETLTDPLVGRVVDGRYLVRERIAQGGMATVYVAVDRRLGRDVALKVMHANISTDSTSGDFSSRFRREARAAARLTHPGMVRVYDQGVDGEVSYLTMEYVHGMNLREQLQREGTLSLGQAFRDLEAVLDALAAAHRQGLVHRDVKPENILIDTEEQRPRLADFGLARAVTEVTSATTGTILGTVAYLSPELISRGQSDARTDVYSCGIMLFELITGRQPFTGDTALDVATRHVHEDIAPPSSYVAWLPPEVDQLVATLAHRDPDRRPADASAALALVRQTRAMMDEPTLARRGDPPSGHIPLVPGGANETEVLAHAPSGKTVALPIGLGQVLTIPNLPDADLGDDPEARDPEHRTHKRAWWTAAILTTLAVLGALTIWWYATIGPGAYTNVPPVVGSSAEQASAIITSAGLEPSITLRNDDTVLEGIVIATNPAAQEQILDKGVVEIVVSQGPKMTTVPITVGVDESDAVARLNELRLPVGDVTRVYSDTVVKGEVMASSVAAGEVVRHDTPVSLTVSNGPEPIQIPPVTGVSEETARVQLDFYALQVTVVHELTNEAPKGEVFRQDPAAGAEGFRTGAVTIWVSDGPPFVEVPDFTFNSVDLAVQRAEELGLTEVLEPKWPWSGKNFITGQSVTPGESVAVGSTITLEYN